MSHCNVECYFVGSPATDSREMLTGVDVFSREVLSTLTDNPKSACPDFHSVKHVSYRISNQNGRHGEVLIYGKV